MKRSLITGVTGQDGSYLAELLLNQGIEVHGMLRRSSQFARQRIEHLRSSPLLKLHYSDLYDASSLRRVLEDVRPDYLYHLAGQSHVGLSFELPESTLNESVNSTMSILEVCRDLPTRPRVLLVGSSEIFGRPKKSPQTENTPHHPVNPYGLAKSCVVNMARVYREAYGLHVACIIPYNHESIRRGENFVTRKITSTVARQISGSDEVLRMGNLDSSRDWGYAPEYVEAMNLVIEDETPDEFILATGKSCSVRNFLISAYVAAGISVRFEGEGLSEHGFDQSSGRVLVEIDKSFFRPVESESLIGNPQKIKERLGWSARTVGTEVANVMLRQELEKM